MERSARQFEEYIDRYKKLVFSVCLSFARNPVDAEDLAQETFLAAWRALGRFDGVNPKAWLATIAANKCRDFLKSPARGIVPVEGESFPERVDEAPSPAERLERRVAETDTAELCGRLREPYRSVALGYFVGQMTITELARLRGDNPKTVATRLYRAKRQLKELLAADSLQKGGHADE